MADAIVVGAGPAGLACAATFRGRGIDAVVLDKADTIGSVWRRHYDRLHLHTDRYHSGLPGMTMPRHYPRYPSRAQVVAYLEQYAAHFGIEPALNTKVSRVAHDGAAWRAETDKGAMSAPIVVVATGWANFPYRPSWPGMEHFAGPIVHSSDYRNPAPYAGKRVLVVGFGNSGGEIALDLADSGIDVTLAVRGPVQILPRDLLGLPILTWAIAQKSLPAGVVDFINAPAIRLAIGSLESAGLRRAAKGPRMIEEDGRVPLLDIGTMAKIRAGAIKVRGGIERVTPDGVVFEGGAAERFDAIVLATGFHPDLRALLPDTDGVLDGQGRPLLCGRTTAAPGLYFCGLIAVATGQFREIAIEAERIADLARTYLARRNHREAA